MEIGVNLALIGEVDFSQLPEIFEKLGTKNIELPIRLWQQSNSTNSYINGLKIIGFNNLFHKTSIFPLSVFVEERLFEEQYKMLEEKLDICERVDCTNVSLGIDPWTDINEKIAKQIFIERVEKCALKAVKKNIVINLEYISHKVAKNNGEEKEFLFCASLKDAVKLIREINRPNVKLLLDFLHWYRDNERESLVSINEILGFIHVCDHLQTNQEKVNDQNRILPFEGKLPLKNFLQEIKQSNYLGPLTVEVFRSNSYTPSYGDIKKSLERIKEILS